MITGFQTCLDSLPTRSPSRIAITRQTRRPEEEAVRELLPEARLGEQEEGVATHMALRLAEALRKNRHPGVVDTLVQEFGLASEEGVALMSLAEALLRTPDVASREALIRDQVSLCDWMSHAGRGQGLVINAASWGLCVAGKMVDPSRRIGVVRDVLRQYGEPVIRHAVHRVMHMMGDQFVLGETIGKALQKAQQQERNGFTYSYDMLGEAALDRQDAERYRASYQAALEAIGQQARRQGGASVYERPGLSIKLSALHPRYSRAQRERVMDELVPVVRALAVRAAHYGIGLNIDAEESERLELSLDIFEILCHDPALAGWNGLGFVVQAYGRRASSVVDYLIELARASHRRLMVRLVKGAYWDSEIKKAQTDGAVDFPVFTRKCHTDVSYLACARRMLDAPDALFPQFATHNACTVASIYAMAQQRGEFTIGQYEFQCLHGMGEGLYKEVVGPLRLDRPCRIYAPVGTYKTLLPYLVRRLLENGANSSFVHQVGDVSVSLEQLVEDPVLQAEAVAPLGSGLPYIRQPRDLFGKVRRNSAGMDLNDESTLRVLCQALEDLPETITATPLCAGYEATGAGRPVINPADHHDVVGQVIYATSDMVNHAVGRAAEAFGAWAAWPPAERADVLERAADMLEEHRVAFMALAVREAGKTWPNAVAEVREAVDFLRYYAAEIRTGFHDDTHRPLGPVVCISPWNFPLAIFVGQVAAALAAGNTVLAKPAEETPLMAFWAVTVLHMAGVPAEVLYLLPGEGDIGAALVADRRIAGVIFTGSTAVAQSIGRQLVGRLGRNGQPVPLVAETGGQNAMIVDSTALPEQVVADILASAFDSAGQRCSALRLLCIQDDAAPRVLSLLRGALTELRTGHPARLKTDIGPVITKEAQQAIEAYCGRFRAKNHKVVSALLDEEETRNGYFVAPHLIEIHSLDDLEGEIFGPVLHVLCYHRLGLSELVRNINATGYGLTFGVHSRLSSTIRQLVEQVDAGNLYINRNMIGAVVGVQPFGGRGLSGTGPKAGGPLTLRRQLAHAPLVPPGVISGDMPDMARSWLLWLGVDDRALVHEVRPWMEHGLLGVRREMPSPVGESNVYTVRPRGRVLVLAQTEKGLKRIISYALSCGNTVVALCPQGVWDSLHTMSEVLREAVRPVQGREDIARCAVILAETEDEALWQIMQDLLANAAQPVPLAFIADEETLRPDMLVEECLVSTNTAAAGGNATLMAQV